MSTQTNPQTTDQSSLSQQLGEMILGFQVSQLIHVAATLGLADVLKDGPNSCEDLAQADRCALVAGSHLEAVPCGGDVYLLKSIIDGEDDAHATVILQNCRRAMADRGRLVLVDWVIPPGNAPSRTKVSDITMLVMVGGVVRTEAEFRALFAAAGFRLTAIVPTAAQYSILEGVPV